MFRKGIVTFFDDALGKGFIEINTDQQSVGFLLEDFSNASLLPQVGERVKCVVLEQDGELLAKFIVRLDHKNYTGGQKGQSAIVDTNSENVLAPMPNARKLVKKRRTNLENEDINNDLLQNFEKETKQENSVQTDESIQANDLKSQFKVFVDENTQIESNEVLLKEEDIKKLPEQHIDELVDAQNIDIVQHDEVPNIDLKDHLADKVKQLDAINNHITSENNASTMQNDQAESFVDSIQSHEQQASVQQNHLESTDFQNIQVEKIQVEKAQQDVQQNRGVEIAQDAVGILSERDDLKQNHQYLSNRIDQKMLEKNMNLSVFQRLIQTIKVKFFYSKRKQSTKVKTDGTSFHLNPLIVVMGAFVLLCLGSVKYAYERYQQYKVETELKLQQYEKQQQDVIKKQKQEAHAR
ncbi:hypothetical protein EXU29_11885 [Acinetobacter wuhouensis]|uniref:hypothetical protein n=1 Tax=Acinetobacter wuhouensis TaxID=1879050 RepID=UPI001023F24D|nr:hypothetical protein [Acinetobacter wuhouensis]RZG72077.1 hypothetical protein EXU29_11885 [Acinetobacter wuhouensis]